MGLLPTESAVCSPHSASVQQYPADGHRKKASPKQASTELQYFTSSLEPEMKLGILDLDTAQDVCSYQSAAIPTMF